MTPAVTDNQLKLCKTTTIYELQILEISKLKKNQFKTNNWAHGKQLRVAALTNCDRIKHHHRIECMKVHLEMHLKAAIRSLRYLWHQLTRCILNNVYTGAVASKIKILQAAVAENQIIQIVLLKIMDFKERLLQQLSLQRAKSEQILTVSKVIYATLQQVNEEQEAK